MFVHPSLELGGAERQSLILAERLVEDGAHVEMVGFESKGQLARQCDQLSIRWSLVPLNWQTTRRRKLQGLCRLALALRRLQPDVLLPYTTLPNIACGLVWRWTGAKTCIWNQRAADNDIPPARLERWAVGSTPCFIANSRHGADFLTSRFHLDPASVHVIANGIEIPAPARASRWRARLAIDEHAFVACKVASLSHYKDHETLLRAWSIVVRELHRSGRDAVLLLAGRFAGTHERLKSLAFDLELGRSVRFLDHVDDVAELLGAVDLGVFSSRSEGSPNGVLECMAAGLPVAATDESGVRDALGIEGHSFLAAPGDAAHFADIILRFAADPELCREMGRVNRCRVETHFSVATMCERTVNVIADLLNR